MIRMPRSAMTPGPGVTAALLPYTPLSIRRMSIAEITAMPIPAKGGFVTLAGACLVVRGRQVALREPVLRVERSTRRVAGRNGGLVRVQEENPAQFENVLFSRTLPCAASRMKSPNTFPYATFFQTVASAFSESPT